MPRWERQRDGRLVDVANSRFDLLPRSAQESWKVRAAALVDVAEAYPHADAVDLAALAHSDDRGSSMLFVDLSSNEQLLRVAFAEAVRRVLAEMQRSARREFS